MSPGQSRQTFEDSSNLTDLVADIIERHRGRLGEVMAILAEIQTRFGYLPKEALQFVADQTGRDIRELYHVATFYKSFSLTPRGKHQIHVCTGTACHVRGASKVVDEVETALGCGCGETTEDGEFTLETVACLGACALGPIVVADGHYFSNVGVSRVSRIVKQVRKGLDDIDLGNDPRVFPINVRCPHCNRSLMDEDRPIDGHPSIRLTCFSNQKHGSISISSLWGSYNVESKHAQVDNTVSRYFCRHCNAELQGTIDCADCGAPMVPLFLGEGGMVQFCSRTGCKGHLLDLGDNRVLTDLIGGMGA